MKNEESQDEWGHDPSVQTMRRIFRRMEEGQKDLLETLKLSPLDGRLRHLRDSARLLFDREWPHAQRRGLTRKEEDAATLYLHCLVRVLNQEGIKVPATSFPGNQNILDFLSERFR
jgi:hypothetical protein